jgi:hypothetical protein
MKQGSWRRRACAHARGVARGARSHCGSILSRAFPIFTKMTCIKEPQQGTKPVRVGWDGGRRVGEEGTMDAEHPKPLEMLAVPVGGHQAEYEEGGDAVCWAHLVCPECGAIVTEGHRAGCEASTAPIAESTAE